MAETDNSPKKKRNLFNTEATAGNLDSTAAVPTRDPDVAETTDSGEWWWPRLPEVLVPIAHVNFRPRASSRLWEALWPGGIA